MGWTISELSDLIVFQRGFDITKAQQNNGMVPIISSSGISSYHNQPKCKAPGVITGRKGTLGKVFYSKVDYWPHDTTLWVKDFKENNPRYAYYFLQLLKFETYDVGSSNPTLNRNHIHKLKIKIPHPSIQKKMAITEILKHKKLFKALFKGKKTYSQCAKFSWDLCRDIHITNS